MSTHRTSPESTSSAAPRLQPLDRSAEIKPWRRAEQLTRCFLYWLPMTGPPIRAEQKQWILVFMDRLEEFLAKEHGLRSEVFLQVKVIYPNLTDLFTKMSFELCPMMGLSRVPGGRLPAPVTMEEVVIPLQKGEKQFDFKEFCGDYCFWFTEKLPKVQRQHFFGFGGMTTIYLPPDPKTKAPPVRLSPKIRQRPFFKQFDVDRIQARSYAMTDAFHAKSKQLFGKGLEDNAQWPGIFFVVPLLSATHFFQCPDDECSSWFDLFGVYVNESPDDKGLILASKIDLDDFLVEQMRKMSDEKLVYPI
jgi:hypothetical protein